MRRSHLAYTQELRHFPTFDLINTTHQPLVESFEMAASAIARARHLTSGEDGNYQLSRQSTTSSRDGTRSIRQSKRYYVNAIYQSMTANNRDLEIEDDLARGRSAAPFAMGGY